ncbi:MAG: class I SAM-dependent methyltransferase [Planctomycetota bacterium]
MSREIELWRAVAGDTGLLQRAEAIDPSDVSAVAALRRDYDADAVSVAFGLVEARAKAARKFGEFGQRLVADALGVEQASGVGVAAYKAGRIAQTLGNGELIADLCCGIGGDSMALADAGFGVVCVDRDPLRVWMAMQNTSQRVQGICADVRSLVLDGKAVHIDPARRNEATSKRAWRLEDYQPGPEFIERLIDSAAATAIKLSPGVDLAALPWPGEVEFISEGGRLVQAVLWTGGFAQAARRATLIVSGAIHQLAGEAAPPAYQAPQRYLYTFDPSVERAGLVGQLSTLLDAPAIHPKLGLLTSNTITTSPWIDGFELIERMPWRPKRIKQWLAANDGGLIEVKTRGKACDPDIEQRRLRGDGSTTYTVFVLRFDTKVQALMTKRIRQK